MGKLNGFLEYSRQENTEIPEKERIHNYCEFHLPLSMEKRKEQAARCMNCGVPFCQYGQPINGMTAGCPLNNLIPEWNDSLYRSEYDNALERLLKTDDFPEFTSRVCPALCEKACTCGLNGEPVSVRENEYAIIEKEFQEGKMKPVIPSVRLEYRAAVIGSGPAGLACADQLNQRGYHVDVYEKNDRFGGLLMYGIPNMKLDKKIVERRIQKMQAEGIVFLSGQNMDTREKAEHLQEQYDAVILACGCSVPRPFQAEGSQAENIVYALDYLTAATRHLMNDEEPVIDASDRNVIVLGGGDTGNDCIATCIRQGCRSCIQLEIMPAPLEHRGPDNPWPEWPRVKKTDYGQKEAAAVFGRDPRIFETTVTRIIQENGRMTAVETVQCRQIPNPQTGRMEFRNVKGTERILSCDLLLIAAGFIGVPEKICDAFQLKKDSRGRIVTESDYHIRGHLFTAGDMHRGQSLVVYAIQEGRECARQTDCFLNSSDTAQYKG